MTDPELRARAGAGSVIGPRSARLGHLVRERSGPNKDHAGPVLSSSRATKGAGLVRANLFPDQIIKLSRARSNEGPIGPSLTFLASPHSF